MRGSSVFRQGVIIVALTWMAIEIHEFGHLFTYWLFGYHAHMSLQRVTPIGEVLPSIDHWAKLAGPALSLTAGAAFLLVARNRYGWIWVTAGFTNASLRLFPCSMDLLRAIRGGPPFSDEGEVALALTNSVVVRSILISFALAFSLTLTVLAAKQYRFEKYHVSKSVLIYLVTLAVGIGVVIADELLGLSR